MAHFLLIYEFVDDYLERRGALREAHLTHAWATADRGELVLAGALADPVDRGILLFEGDGPEPAEAFAAADPYVTEGLVVSWQVRRWSTVVGDMAGDPIRPER